MINHNSDFVITAFTAVAVPEPSTAVAVTLAGLACCGWHTLRRRRTQA